MPFKRHFDLPEPVTAPACVHLRSKRMYVHGDLPQPELAEQEAYFWCNQTQHVIGPDSNLVSRRQCIGGRACYRDCR